MSEKEEPREPAEGEAGARKVRALDPRSLRGLAHPLRMRLFQTLRQDGPATASRLAEKLGESSGATSYHLRQLAAHGFVEDDPERGKGRERWWKASIDGMLFDHALYTDPDPTVRGAADLYLHEHATMHTQEVATWLGTLRDWPEEWQRVSDLSDFTLRLTAAQAHELSEKIHTLIESYRDHERAPGTEGAAQVRLHLHAFPRSTG
ncbi:ArsR/SmtB family transcription factor [Streptomyces peucetius]|uniref:Helix-turn-helix domain-containing protein n=1 Tax=Streptomyces peucetius TaxID=1950 RepID=A0ABY6I690_STRPE|nr:helix-turn-helix domain-containing protein [Streptomyces peucetius]UYQ62361.1 helix-turn-helix domain-containing protein [Streptomyces peucetius]